MRKSPCRFLIPLAYNDGKPVSVGVFMKIKSALDRQFGGYRIITEQQEGSWCGQVEGMMEIEVAVVPKRIPDLRRAVIAIGKQLKQKAMYFNCPDPSVEILDVETGEMIEEEE